MISMSSYTTGANGSSRGHNVESSITESQTPVQTSVRENVFYVFFSDLKEHDFTFFLN